MFTQSWQPEAVSKAAVIIVHGWAEHSSRYLYVAEYLTKSGYAVYAFDLAGHGHSEGRRAFVRSFDEYQSELSFFLQRVSKEEPGKLIFILGHSLGATIATLFVIKEKPAIGGLILSGPLFKTPENISPLLKCLILTVARIFPMLLIVKRLDSSLLSADPKVVSGYNSDPLVYRGKMRAGLASEINRVLDFIQRNMNEISLPLLLLHGGDDRIADIEGSRGLYSCAGSKDKTLKIYDGFRHEVLNEIKKEAVFKDIVVWLDERAKIVYTQ